MTVKSAIIIGGGIAGCSMAYALANRGVAVTIVEQHGELAAEASGNPIATLYPKFSAHANAQSTLALRGFAFTLNLLRQLANNSDFFNACGQIQLAYDAREQARQQALLAQYGDVFFKVLNAKQASEIAGIKLKKGGLLLPQAGWVKPKAFCNALINMPINAKKITKIMNTHVLVIEKNADRWQVKCAVDSNEHLQKKTSLQYLDLSADIVVLCNANQVRHVNILGNDLSTTLPCTPVRGQVNFFAPTTASRPVNTIVCSTHYLSPAVDGLHSIGATYAPNDLNPQLSAADSLDNLTALKRISPEIFDSIQPYEASGRVAWRSHTPDYLPLAGELLDEKALREKPPRYNSKPADLPWLQGLYVNAGHGSKGMITAPICAELIADLACKKVLSIDATLASKMHPSRFLLKELGLKQLANSLYKNT